VIFHFLSFSNNLLTLQLHYRTKLMLFDYVHPWSAYFHPLPYPCHIFISASEPSHPSLPPPPSTRRWETPLGSSTPAWDPHLLHHSVLACLQSPTGPQYALLDARLDGIKVTATINGRQTTVWGTLVGGE